jgi:hypothetical protein
MDNYCTHKNFDAWLASHPNVFFHYTHNPASWLNLAEVYFGKFTRHSLKGASLIAIESKY